MNIKIFCRCNLFPSWSGYGLISTPTGVLISPVISTVVVPRTYLHVSSALLIVQVFIAELDYNVINRRD
jgi:hypothetical protein